jgi:hypothetical protein
MESLKPRAVIAGHKRPGNDDSPKIIEGTRQYIRDFERLAMQTTTAQELYDQCSSSTLIGSIEVRSGLQCVP